MFNKEQKIADQQDKHKWHLISQEDNNLNELSKWEFKDCVHAVALLKPNDFSRVGWMTFLLLGKLSHYKVLYRVNKLIFKQDVTYKKMVLQDWSLLASYIAATKDDITSKPSTT